MENIKRAQEEFKELIESEYARIDKMKQAEEATDFSKKEKIIVGILRRWNRADHHGAGSSCCKRTCQR